MSTSSPRAKRRRGREPGEGTVARLALPRRADAGLDGFGVIKKLLDRKLPLPQIVFATAFDQYAVKAFEVNAIDYLLKPFDRKRVAQAVEKARQKLETAGSPTDQIGTIVKLLEQQQRPPAAKVLLKSMDGSSSSTRRTSAMPRSKTV